MSLPAGLRRTSGNVQTRLPHCWSISSVVVSAPIVSFTGRATAMIIEWAPRMTSPMRYTFGHVSDSLTKSFHRHLGFKCVKAMNSTYILLQVLGLRHTAAPNPVRRHTSIASSRVCDPVQLPQVFRSTELFSSICHEHVRQRSLGLVLSNPSVLSQCWRAIHLERQLTPQRS